jgi:hypothetical protein
MRVKWRSISRLRSRNIATRTLAPFCYDSPVSNRKSLTPPQGVPAPKGMHAMRRGGARRDASDRVTLKKVAGEGTLEGWALNVSRGGVRVILEDAVTLGMEFDVTVGDPDQGGTAARGRIVWVQEEPDGVIAGIEFVGESGTHGTNSTSHAP